MKTTHEVQIENCITLVSFKRQPTFEKAKAAINDLVKNYPYELRLWDFSNSGFDFSNEEIEYL